jgi:hypothetical protein
MRWLRLALLCFALFAVVFAQSPVQPSIPTKGKPPDPPAEDGPIKPHATTDSGVREALRDIGIEAVFGAGPVTRYIFIDDTDEELFKATVLALHYVLRASHPIHYTAIPGPLSVIIRVDLSESYPGEKNLADVLKVWEGFRFDPQFNLLLTPDVVELSAFSVKIPDEAKTGETLRFNAPDLDQQQYEILKAVTGSQAPIVDYRYLIFRALSTIKDDGPYRDIFGGLYYDLRGIKKADAEQKKKGATDQDVFFETLGVGNIAAGEPYEKLLDRVRGDLRPSLFISDVTGHPRSVVAFHTPGEREGGSWGAVTWDLKRKSIDVRQHPVLSQIKPKIDAQEAIFGTAVLPIFALFDGKGNLLEKADADVVADRTAQAPHDTELQSAISCIRCHSEETWKPLRDDIAGLLEADRVRIFADVQFSNDLADSQDRVLALHSVIPGRPPGPRTRQQRILDKLLQRERDDFGQMVAEITGPWKRLTGHQEDVGKVATAKIASIYADFWYSPVSAHEALLDIGLSVPPARSADVLTKLLAEESGKVLGVQFEDIRLTQLAAGGKIGRADWSLIRSFAAGRVNAGVAKLLKP